MTDENIWTYKETDGDGGGKRERGGRTYAEKERQETGNTLRKTET